MARVTKPGGWVAVTDAVEHPYEWMRTGHAD
jgi:ubiquinone/menaquinone biosynthesis C-methylase UbiE